MRQGEERLPVGPKVAKHLTRRKFCQLQLAQNSNKCDGIVAYISDMTDARELK